MASPAGADARWLIDYEKRTLEVIAANATLPTPPEGEEDLPRAPRQWPASGAGVTKWNPSGYPQLKKREPKVIFDKTLHDERTSLGSLPKRPLRDE